ncbi:MAG TPA: O-antigen ligase family protein [Acidimicrobiales bacterium]|nr:O-antigen ligase family protein [Acidimicrobiales bacterium]
MSQDGAVRNGAAAESIASTALSADVDRRVQRRITAIWLLLFFNVLGSAGTVFLFLPHAAAQLMTMSALGVALFLALSLNRRLLFRPNVVLGLFTLLAVLAFMTTIRGTAGVGGVVRAFRFLGFLSVLWLLTPWWGRRDLLLARCHLRALVVVSATVLAGVLIAPSAALGGRLAGILWPIPPPQVAEYAAVTVGMAVVLWLSGRMPRAQMLFLTSAGVTMVLLTHTRTAAVALVGGVGVAALTLFLTSRRTRRALQVGLVLLPVAVVALAPAALNWFARGQSTDELAELTGRARVWEMLLDAPRSDFNKWFGFGLSDKSFAGLSIDSTWLALYQDEGVIGLAIVGVILIFLLVKPAFRPPDAARAVATFLVVYTAIASYTEVGLGDASPYVLHLIVAASLLTTPPVGGGEPNSVLP